MWRRIVGVSGVAALVFACSSGGSGAIGDGGNRPIDGAVRLDGGGFSDVVLSSSDASFGPCSLATVGYASATPVTPRDLLQSSCAGLNSALTLLQSESDVSQYRADAGLADAGEMSPVDWNTESVLVITNSVNAYTFGRDGSTLEVSVGALCQGTPPLCERTFAAVPKVDRIEIRNCPRPVEPCTAP